MRSMALRQRQRTGLKQCFQRRVRLDGMLGTAPCAWIVSGALTPLVWQLDVQLLSAVAQFHVWTLPVLQGLCVV